jgi:hypothetical protein
LQRVVDATRTVVGVDGVGLTLAHEDSPPRWVATTDRAMELLEQIQEDFGEGPCLAAYAEDRVVAVEDLRRAPRWDRIAAVVGQLQVRGMVSVPVRLAGQPVGTLNAYSTSPRARSAQEIDGRCCIAPTQGVLELRPRPGSDRRGQLIERDGHPPVRRVLDSQLVVPAPNVLHERVPGDHDFGTASCLSPRIGRSRDFSRPWSASTRLLA